MTSGTDGRLRISSGSPYEAVAGYCRALRVGNLVYVAGTAAYQDGEVYAPGDAGAQTRRVFEIIEAALRDAGSGLPDVVRCRVFVTDIGDADAVATETGRVFASIRPVMTLVAVSALVHPDLVVEIEVDAVVGDSQNPAAAAG